MSEEWDSNEEVDDKEVEEIMMELEKKKKTKVAPLNKEPLPPVIAPRTNGKKPLKLTKKGVPRKSPGPASEAQKARLAEGRAKAQQSNEIKKLETEAAKKERLAKLKRLQKAAENEDHTKSELAAVKKEMAELKSKPVASPPINIVMPPAYGGQQLPKMDPRQEAELRRYCRW